MGIYIKGMEMPISEEKCKFYQSAPFRLPYCPINGVCNGLESCPLAPVPPHGRLIDADALFEKVYKAWGTEYDAGECNWFMNMINEAPTIIPASGD